LVKLILKRCESACVLNYDLAVLLLARERSYADAVDWYEAVVNTTSEDDGGEFDAAVDDPVYQLQAAMAQLYLVGGYGLQKDPSCAGVLTDFSSSLYELMYNCKNNEYSLLARGRAFAASDVNIELVCLILSQLQFELCRYHCLRGI